MCAIPNALVMYLIVSFINSDPESVRMRLGTPNRDYISSRNRCATFSAVLYFTGNASTQPDSTSMKPTKYLLPASVVGKLCISIHIFLNR